MTEDIVYQIQEIEDQIPMKIQGSQDAIGLLFSKEKGWRTLSTFADNILDKIYLFDENQYQEREYEIITYDKKIWDALHRKLSNLQVQMPPFMELVRQNQTGFRQKVKCSRSLLNIKIYSKGHYSLSEGINLLKFLEFTQKKIPKHSHFLRKLEKCQFIQLKHFGQFDLEIQETENHENLEAQNICYNFKLGFLSQNQKNLFFSPLGREGHAKSFSENIWLIPKPQRIEWNNSLEPRAQLEIGILKHPQIAISLKNWNPKTIPTTFDNYLKKSSRLLQLQDKNPYLYFDQIITPEDYLLETLFFFIKQNLMKFEPKLSTFGAPEGSLLDSKNPPLPVLSGENWAIFQNFENQGSNESSFLSLEAASPYPSNLSHLVHDKNLSEMASLPITPSVKAAISKILNYLNHRKKQRVLAFKNSSQILQMKNLLEEKRKIQTSILYHSILNNYILPRMLGQQQNFRQKENISIELKKFKQLFPSIFVHIQNWLSAQRATGVLGCHEKNNNIFLVNFHKLQKKLLIKNGWLSRPNGLKNVFFLLEKTNFQPVRAPWVNSGEAPRHHLLLNLYKFKNDLKFQWLWAQRLENIYLPSIELETSSDQGKIGKTRGAEPFPIYTGYGSEPNFSSCWVNLIKFHNEKKPYECMGKYYFIRKLPQIPQNVDSPVIATPKTKLFAKGAVNKKSYPYRVINLPIMTSLKKTKINYGKEILAQLNDSINLQNQLYDPFLCILNPFVRDIPNPIHLKNLYPSPKASHNLKTPRSAEIWTSPRIFVKASSDLRATPPPRFPTIDVLENFYNDKDSEIYQMNKCLGQKQPIYKIGSRKMSGYIFPDLERKQLAHLFQIFNPNIELEISISNITGLTLNELLKQLPELQIQKSKVLPSADRPQSGEDDFAVEGQMEPSVEAPWISKIQTFKHQPKISQKRFWDSSFFEFRENVNNYSWSIIFLLSSGWLFINLFKNLYKKYAKEFVESGIDFLKRAGILDDVQWIKEELGMAPIDKGYRGIRHPGIQRKKFKNIIGLERKHIISQVSEMVWFLKTKKLMKSTSIDPFIQVILLLNRNYDSLITKTTKNRLMAKLAWRRFASPPRYVLKEISPSYLIIQKNLQILFPESKTYQTVEISPQQKETLRPFRFRLEKITNENENENGDENGNGNETGQAGRTKSNQKDISFLALKRNRNQVKPKGFLFTGPPGTGKTLLVQAIAGETSVPVVTQSGGLLQNPRLRGKGAITLHKLFLRAREIAPCIIFIDEIDGIGTRRQFLPLYIDIYGRYDPIEWLESDEAFFPPKIYQTKLQRRAEFLDDHDPYWEEPEFTQTVQSVRIPIDVLQDLQFSRGARSEQLSMLTQLLIELDGLHSLENILVIGATNRLEILDPALMRPGRFQRILRFHLPNYHARINLLKLYTHSSKIGIENISWDYFSKRTHGLSSADIASIVFASELTAIQQSKTHTFETLERGIDLITSFPSDPVMFRLKNIFIFLENSLQKFFSKNHFYSMAQIPANDLNSFEGIPLGKGALQETSNIYRNCYYNIGKLVVLFCLQIMPFSSAYISLWIRPKNFRFFFFTKNYEFDELDQKMFSRKEIEKRLLAFFGGKAAESLFIFLPLHKFSSEIYFHFDPTFLSINNSLEQSNFGIDNEIQTAQSLLKLMVEKWYFYLERIATEKFHPILENANLWEYSEKEIFFNQALIDEMIIDLDMRNRLSKNEQKYSYQTWWMKKVATRLNYRENLVLHWSRIYLSDPEDSAQNIEWIAPDEYFHTILRTRPYCMAWTHFLENGRFAISNILLLQSFNTVFKTLRQFSEFMDFLADYFLRYECIREIEFQTKISQFFSYFLS